MVVSKYFLSSQEINAMVIGSLYNNIVSQVRFWEGRMYPDLTLPLWGVEKLFSIDLPLKRSVIKA